MAPMLLILNAGSSSIKFALYPGDARPERGQILAQGACDGIGHDMAFHVTYDGQDVRHALPGQGHAAALDAILGFIATTWPDHALIGVGHRVVHGGMRYYQPVRIDDEVIAEITRLIPLAPLHQPHHLAAIAAIKAHHPDLPQIACFDTAFHHGQSPIETSYALPHDMAARGIRRYGFHGLSYEYITSQLPRLMGAQAAQGRIVIAHLGAGASMCAVHQGKSIASTMGFTALDGLPMATRCGQIDPGLLIYLIQNEGMTGDDLTRLLYKESGLQGISGITGDMRALLASSDPHAVMAIDIFIHRIKRELGGLAAAMGGLDALIFTGGIGEHASAVRRRVCLDAAWLGITLDEPANQAHHARISTQESSASAWVIPTDEDLMIARHSYDRIQADRT